MMPWHGSLRGLARLGLALTLALLAAGRAGAESGGVWVLIDTVAQRLDVYRDQTPLVRFRNISLGSGGTALVRRAGDQTTPLGEFHITRINRDSRFHIFLGLNYPTERHIERALDAGLIDEARYVDLLGATFRQGVAPQDSELGGNIGIHGLGQGDPDVHQRYNWTQGCVALTNEQMEQLTKFIDIGTRVLIR